MASLTRPAFDLHEKSGDSISVSEKDKADSTCDVETQGKTSVEEDWENDPEYASIPRLVRDTISFEDDPTESTITFRVLVLTTAYVCLGAFVGQLAMIMARYLPAYTVPLGRLGFSLNPGPFSRKEHVLIGMAANAGASGMWATTLAANGKIYFDIDMNPFVALFFGWATAIIGFGFAALVRGVLIYDPIFIFPLSLQQVTLYRSLQTSYGDSTTAKNESEAEIASQKRRTQRQMKVFWILCASIFVWQWFPEYIFPMVSALAPLCWFGGHNKAASFLGSGIGGVGLLNITLDWSNIQSSVITQPWFVQVLLFVGFVFTTWILIPIVHFGNIWGSPTYSVMSNGIYMQNGSSYPFNTLLTPDGQLNETLYEEVGPPFSGAQYLWDNFFWCASFTSSFSWMCFFLGPNIWAVVKSHFTKESVHNDKISKMNRIYPQVTVYEWISIFLAAVVTLIVIIVKGNGVYMPLFTFFAALGIGLFATLPMSLVYAISGFELKTGIFNELVYGYTIDAPGSSRHPLGLLAYRIVAGNVWYDCRKIIEDQKIGHYMHIPPRAVIFSQLLGSFIGLPVNYAAMRWVVATRLDYLRGIKVDPIGQWTGQELKGYNSAGIQYGLVGPSKLFQEPIYKPILWGFLLGAGTPAIIWLLHKKWKGPKFHLWNTTILFANMAEFRGNISTGPFTRFLLGFVFNFYLYRKKYQFWRMWAYISGAALDTGFNLNLLVLFATIGTSGAVMPHWWGNNAQSVERCFGKVK
ncbi:hypothetical protein D9758_000899 [Tetrapyrgos nigripes]|uniref:Uncharacterized protein n=1 Tax=Tetrapyrgos nigripes TaxID=182062 RepID=A0A8H5GZ35_9AGAR|nr:hypothetical protein D9758_000899 [Tetrapyrgos nigripes]